MKVITRNAVQSFYNNQPKKFGNTEVTVEDGVTKLFLFDNLIAKKENGVLKIRNAGWQSNTTKERLNALDGVSINQSKGVWYLNGIEWDGQETEI
jgi:hypothetical protein